MLKLIYNFIFKNKNRWLTVKAFLYAAYYRMCVLLISMDKLKKKFGILNNESSEIEEVQHYYYASRVSMVVNRVARRTPWESKCLIQALTAQRLLMQKKIPSTLYLGVGKEDKNMVAHAWLRCGEYYITGGNGEGYAIVARFSNV